MSVVAVLFMLGVGMIFAGIFARVGTEAITEIDANVAATMALLVTYVFLLLSFTSLSELVGVFEMICGGIPYVDKIADYGSLSKVFHEAPLEAAASFLDVVFLTVIIDLLSLLPLTSGSAVGKFMVKVFTGIVLSMVSLIVLNYVVKGTGIYRFAVASVGACISLISVGTVPWMILSLIKGNKAAGAGLIAALYVFSRSKIVAIMRDAFLKAIIYVLGIYILEQKFGTIAAGMSWFSIVVVAFAPSVIMIVGIVIMIKCVFGK